VHLKPINRQGKKRRKLVAKPSLSCGWTGFHFQAMEENDVVKSPEAQTQKDQAAA